MQTPASRKRIAVTGHRPDKLGGYDENNPLAIAIKRHMRAILLRSENIDVSVVSGMALGVDQWWAEAAIELDIPFIAAIPFDGFHERWPRESQERFRSILGQAQGIVYVCAPGYEPRKMQARNEWMVDNSDQLIAYWNGSNGGTANCLAYARTKKILIEVFDPRMIQ